MKGVTPDGHSLYNLANISYTGILSVNLGVHIGVYQPCPRFFIRWLPQSKLLHNLIMAVNLEVCSVAP